MQELYLHDPVEYAEIQTWDQLNAFYDKRDQLLKEYIEREKNARGFGVVPFMGESRLVSRQSETWSQPNPETTQQPQPETPPDV